MKKFISRYLFVLLHQAIALAKKHNLNPNVFIVLSVTGMIIHGLYYLPWFKGGTVDLALLVTLRFLGLLGPAYIILKGKRVAPAINASFVISWTVSTAWHVCYYVYL
ncbi:hypothetical protein DRJ12_04350 [Candidatus Acetothermia bacterium]|nr:MAG: hypothetical protein DRJ12_04350 [Candidatus Acetothermia bacterium]